MPSDQDEYKPHIAIRHGYWKVAWKRAGVIVPRLHDIPLSVRIRAAPCHAFAARLNNERD